LYINDETECASCSKTTKCISQPRCQDVLCIECFRNHYIYLEDEHSAKEPKFPYCSEIEDEYFRDPHRRWSLKWRDDDLINKYNQEWKRWDDIRYALYKHNGGVRSSPICKR